MWLEFIVGFASAVAWPIAAVVIAVLFRRPLIHAIGRIVEANFPGGFSLRLSEAERIRAQIPNTPDVPETDTKSPNNRRIALAEINESLVKQGFRASQSNFDFAYYDDIADTDPNLALAGLRLEIENSLRNMAKVVELPQLDSTGAMKLARELYQRGHLSAAEYKLFRVVIYACNAAVHGEPVSAHQAKQMIQVAEDLTKSYVGWMVDHQIRKVATDIDAISDEVFSRD